MQRDVLETLRCPEDHSILNVADANLIDELNGAIRDERLVNRAGIRIERVIDGGLVRSAGDRLYPIIDDIPVLLLDEAIDITQLGRRGA
jgi:uncharacterized protein YbaR (Trm112 family)